MADKKKGGMLMPNPRNETGSGEYDQSGGGLYGSYDEVMSAQLSQADADLGGTPNMDSDHGIWGGPAAGEPNPAGASTTSQSRGGKK
jgi:hypothetical protein